MKKLLSLFALLCLAVPQVHAALEFTVSGGDVGAKPIAVVPFATPADINFDIASIIEADLVRSGLFDALAREDMLEKPTTRDQVVFRNWRALNRENVVVGTLMRGPQGALAVRFFLMDVYREKQILGVEMPVSSPEKLRTVAHDIADRIYEALTGQKGYFNTKIAYVTSAGYGPARRHQLVIADADGYAPRTVTSSKSPLVSPAWSPDGKKLAYVGYDRNRMAVYIWDWETGNVRQLVSEKGLNSSPSWSPDGTKLLVTLSFETNPDLYLIDAASGQRKRLTDHYAIDTEGAFSPDGSTIAFTSDRGGSPQVYLMPTTGGEPKRLTFQGKQNQSPRFSSDGKNLAVVNGDGGKYAIGLVDVQTGATRLLTYGPLDDSPSFAPGGNMLIFATAGTGSAELGFVSADGKVHSSARQPGEVKGPAWGPIAR